MVLLFLYLGIQSFPFDEKREFKGRRADAQERSRHSQKNWCLHFRKVEVWQHLFRNNVPQCLIFFANFERYLTPQKYLILIVQIAKIEHCDPGWPLKYAFLHTLKFSCLFLNSFWSENLNSAALLNECSILTYLLQNIKVSVLYT